MLKCATSVNLPCLALSNPPFLQLQSGVAMDSTETGSPPDTLIISEDWPFLPPVVIQRIIEETLSMDMAMLGVFNRVSKTFK